MHSAQRAGSSFEGYVDCFGLELAGEFFFSKLASSFFKSLGDLSLGCVDCLSLSLAFFGSKLSKLLHQEGDLSCLADEASLCILQLSRLMSLGKG